MQPVREAAHLGKQRERASTHFILNSQEIRGTVFQIKNKQINRRVN